MTTYANITQARLAAAELLDDDHGVAYIINLDDHFIVTTDRGAAANHLRSGAAIQVADRYGLPVEILPRLEGGDAIPASVAPEPATPKPKRRVRELPGEDYELLARLKPERERRGLNQSQAARQAGVRRGGYAALEAGNAKYLKTATRAKLTAWLDRFPPPPPPAGPVAEAETNPQAPLVEDQEAAIQQAIAEHEATLHVIAEHERAQSFADLLKRLPTFNYTWHHSVQTRWFDTFDHLASLIAKEAQS
jgi:transcriptional regulator with XRE-family HTH domain